MKGTLYSVAIPIGNPGDITRRAVEILSAVDIIACESTAKLKDMLRRCEISTEARFLAYHSHNEKISARGLIEQMESGKSVALVVSAGTPRVSDPGYHIVRAAHESQIAVRAVPGPAALTAAMSIAPLPVDLFLFLGFISPKPGRRDNILQKYNDFQGTVGFYESVHRIDKLLNALLKNWGDAEVFIVRELTKQHENIYWGALSDSLKWLENNKKGEFIVFVNKSEKVLNYSDN